jgi:hypothetical protein
LCDALQIFRLAAVNSSLHQVNMKAKETREMLKARTCDKQLHLTGADISTRYMKGSKLYKTAFIYSQSSLEFVTYVWCRIVWTEWVFYFP